MRPSIETAKELQKELGLSDVHVVWLDEEGFTLAHTDHERATIPLDECDLHLWLSDRGGIPVEARGWYRAVKHENDPTSESFRSDAGPYDFEPIVTAG